MKLCACFYKCFSCCFPSSSLQELKNKSEDKEDEAKARSTSSGSASSDAASLQVENHDWEVIEIDPPFPERTRNQRARSQINLNLDSGRRLAESRGHQRARSFSAIEEDKILEAVRLQHVGDAAGGIIPDDVVRIEEIGENWQKV